MQKKIFSLSDQIFKELEEKILTGEIPKGEILTETKVASDLQVSRTPVREALTKLTMDHMVEETQKGLLVIGISDDDALIIYDIRERIEGMASGFLISNAGDDDISKLKEILELQEYYLEKENPEKLRELDSVFHETLYKSTKNPVLYDTLSSLHKKVHKYRKKSVSNSERAKASVAEHREIYDMLVKKDLSALENAIHVHIKNARENITAIIQNNEGK